MSQLSDDISLFSMATKGDSVASRDAMSAPTQDAVTVISSVTATVKNPSAASQQAPVSDARTFLESVLVWPGSAQAPGWINVHVNAKNEDPTKNGGKPWVVGWPFKTVDAVMDRINWIATMAPSLFNVWVCMSQQAECAPREGKKPKAVRKAANATWLKAIWIDCDVKPGDAHHYHTMPEAFDALDAFRNKVGLPFPSMTVNSGGGLHIYWVSDTPMSPDEWRPYADGLKALLLREGVKCDTGLTTDIARILRVPGTLNHKYNPPRPVELLYYGTKYDFKNAMEFLKQFNSASSSAPSHLSEQQQSPADVVVPGAVFDAPHPLFVALKPDDNLGVVTTSTHLVDPKPIFGAKGCGFLRHAFKTGGADYDNPKWNLSVLCTAFMENGNAFAHAISEKHSSYTQADTQALYDRKVADRNERGVGYPSCNTIKGTGCAACLTCPHLSKGKSPLHLGLPLPPASIGANQVVVDDVKFRDFDRYGNAKPTLANAVIAIRALGIDVRFDLFHCRAKVNYNGQSKTIHEGLLTDHTVSAVRSLVNNTFLIDCGDANTFAAINEIAWNNAYDPVIDFLNECQSKWDGIKRLETWAPNYLGCDDTPLNRAIGRKTLIAACRRARVPGCKHDEITVLEGPEGIQKSTAIRILAGDENFNDQSILGSSDKDVQEQLEGTWMHENADLAGMKKAEVESVKAFARRQVDRARPAYARAREDRPRRSIEWGTTNNKTYLQSQTGNRCFWPLECGTINIEALRRDRMQLIGEAATCEAAGESIALDRSLWGDAREAQEHRRIADPWEDILDRMPDTVSDGVQTVTVIHKSSNGLQRVASADVLLHVLKIPAAQQTTSYGQRLSLAMANIGWERNKSGLVTINGRPVRGYIRRVNLTVSSGGACVPSPGRNGSMELLVLQSCDATGDGSLPANPVPKDHTEITRPDDARSEAAARQEAVTSQSDGGNAGLINPAHVPVKGKTKERSARGYSRHKDSLCR
jgi:predicted P-loop ATPase